MLKCEFCSLSFQPRPQVKKPRACNSKCCQKKRQSSNEKEWRKKNNLMSDPQYHRLRRKLRNEIILKITEQLFACFLVGSRYFKLNINEEILRSHLFKFILLLGIRRANKFCATEIQNNIQNLPSDVIT